MVAILIIALAVGGFLAYKKFGPKKEVKQGPPITKTIKSTSVKTGGGVAEPTLKVDNELTQLREDLDYKKDRL